MLLTFFVLLVVCFIFYSFPPHFYDLFYLSWFYSAEVIMLNLLQSETFSVFIFLCTVSIDFRSASAMCRLIEQVLCVHSSIYYRLDYER